MTESEKGFFKKVNYLKLCRILFAALPTVVFGVFTVVFTLQQNASARATREQDQRQEDENNRRILFKEYIDDMTDLLLERSHEGNFSEILLHVRIQTLTVLQSLDERRRAHVLSFLYENRLLRNDLSPKLDLRGANFIGIQLQSSSTISCQYPNLYLPGVFLDNITFDGCSLIGSVFDHASLSSAKFLSCSMIGVQFTQSNLTRAQFDGNYMHAVSFSGAYLTQSSITNGFFRNVDLTNADLYQSDISNELLYPPENNVLGVNTFVNTRFPNGSFVAVNKKNLLIRTTNNSQCNSSDRYPSMNDSNNDDHCYLLRNNQSDTFMTINVQNFSLLIDLEQGAFDVSWFIRAKHSRNTRYSVGVFFMYDDNRVNENKLLIKSNEANSQYQFGFYQNKIPRKTRFIVISLLCNFTMNIDEYCIFDRIQLNLFGRRGLLSNI